jgi:hypothetical protein
MRGSGVIAAAAAALVLVLPAVASAADPPPGAAMSSNLDYVKRLPTTAGIVEGKFDEVRNKDVLVITGRFGFKTFDVSDPTDPQLLDEFIPADLAAGGYWQNEDMEIDRKRKLIIGALDPRHTDNPLGLCPAGGSTANPNCKSGFYVISYKDPSNLEQVGDFVSLPSGHTSSCIDNCRYIWTGGPARRSDMGWLGERTIGGRGDGRPIWVTDLRDPEHPRVSDEPVDLWRNDGYTDYSHDVNVDEKGIAWVSGRGGIRGFATSGRHRDPYQNRWRRASPFDPILVAGGGVAGTAQPVMFMHNSERPVGGDVRASGVKKNNVLIGTEEDFTSPCGASGKIVASDLTDSWGGEPGASSTVANPYRMQALDSFHPFLDTPETANPALGCSAHYFEIKDSTLAGGWYGQGLRLLDVSDARDLRQIGYYRVTGTGTDNPSSNSWDTEWLPDKRKGDLVYLFDMSRGVEILRLKKGAHASARMRSVVAPSVKRDRFAAKVAGGLERRGGRYVCPLFKRS